MLGRRGTAVLAASMLVLGLATTSASAAPRRQHGPVVVTADGVLRGLAAGASEEFLGIPYAAPPVGALRWQPPQPAARWHGIRSATRYAPHCAQNASPFGLASDSEDCLYLNVFAPAGSLRRPDLPVMVWIHGGALVTGESDDYDPTELVRDGVVVVTINYRLGALGFLATSTLAAQQDGHAGDYGLMDQQAALRWVQSNIAASAATRTTSRSSASPPAASAC